MCSAYLPSCPLYIFLLLSWVYRISSSQERLLVMSEVFLRSFVQCNSRWMWGALVNSERHWYSLRHKHFSNQQDTAPSWERILHWEEIAINGIKFGQDRNDQSSVGVDNSESKWSCFWTIHKSNRRGSMGS